MKAKKDGTMLKTRKRVHIWEFYRVLTLAMISLLAIECKKEDKIWETIFPLSDSIPVQYDIPFEHVPVTEDIIMYEINLRAFSSSGDFQGVRERLDSVKKLGVNVIWLMPVYLTGELNSIGSPYAVRNYLKVNPDYGTLEDLRLLVKEAHNRGMAVILDWVANHTAWDHVWMKNKSWYVRDDNGNIIHPPGTSWQDVAELNYANTEMRREMIRSMKYWVLEANIDGFRCDYAEGVPLDFWKQAIDTLEKIQGRKIIMFAEAAKKELFGAGFQMIFGWNFYNRLRDVFQNDLAASELVKVNISDYTELPPDAQILRWISNHDNNAWDDTPVSVFQNINGSIAAFVLASYMGGVPLIYNGQEIGCPDKLQFFENSVTKINWTINPDVREEYKRLIAFRKGSEAVKYGSIETFDHNDVMTFRRIKNTEEVLVIVNVRNASLIYELPQVLVNSVWSDALRDQTVTLENTLNLEAFAYRVLRK